jgi:hypothetical protein
VIMSSLPVGTTTHSKCVALTKPVPFICSQHAFTRSNTLSLTTSHVMSQKIHQIRHVTPISPNTSCHTNFTKHVMSHQSHQTRNCEHAMLFSRSKMLHALQSVPFNRSISAVQSIKDAACFTISAVQSIKDVACFTISAVQY